MIRRMRYLSLLIFPFFFLAGCASFEGSDYPPGEDAGAVDQVLGGGEDADPLAATIDLSNEAAEDATEEPFAVQGEQDAEEEESVSGF